jgi:tRNAThr (cytosine32-N3)-methyltransferase
LKPGGLFLIRDYAKGDMAEIRFDAGRKKISDNFFVRKDGTRAYYSTTGVLALS